MAKSPGCPLAGLPARPTAGTSARPSRGASTAVGLPLDAHLLFDASGALEVQRRAGAHGIAAAHGVAATYVIAAAQVAGTHDVAAPHVAAARHFRPIWSGLGVDLGSIWVSVVDLG